MQTLQDLSGFSAAATMIAAHDPDALAQWYCDHLGFESDGANNTVGDIRARRVCKGDVTLLLASSPGQLPLNPPPDPPHQFTHPGLRIVAFWVDDLPAATQALKDTGVDPSLDCFFNPAINVDITVFRDGEGNMLALWQRPQSAQGN